MCCIKEIETGLRFTLFHFGQIIPKSNALSNYLHHWKILIIDSVNGLSAIPSQTFKWATDIISSFGSRGISFHEHLIKKKYQHYFRKIQFKRWWPFRSSPKCVKYIIKIAWRKMFATHSITERKEIISYATICNRVTLVDAPTLVSMCVSPQVGIVNDGMALIIPYTDSHGCITHHHHITLVIN